MLRTAILGLAGVIALGMLSAPAMAQDEASDSGDAAIKSDNPFLHESKLPLQAPPFDKIEDSDFKPAIEEGMKQQAAEVEKIANNPEPPTFENTLVALEKSGRMLERVSLVFGALTSANTNDTLQKIQQEVAPELAAHRDSIFLNEKLFDRIKTIYNKRDSLDLDPEAKRLVWYFYNQFVHAGANLSDADKDKLKELNKEEATLSTEFQNRLLAATKAGALVVDDKSALAGLGDSEIATAADAARKRHMEGKYVIPLQNTTRQPALKSLTNRDTREKLYMNSVNRAVQGDDNDTRDIIKRLAELRAHKARLLGYTNYSGWKLEDQMAKDPDNVEAFLGKLAGPTEKAAREEAADLQKLIEESGGDFKLKPWDWNFYAEKLRKQRYDLDESEIKPYFELNHVLEDGVFYAAHQLYGLTFKERHDLPVYQDDVRVFDVFDKDGSQLAIFYADYYKRDNKSGGAWMSNFVNQSKLLGTKPVIYNVMNIPKSAEGEPTLLTYDETETMFHEFGHALHGMFADQEYPSLSGTNTARDFVEFPSQFNEHWALYPEVFKHYAVHYKTGEPMPQELVDKIKAAKYFNQGFDFTELVAAAKLDMAWHTLTPEVEQQDVANFQQRAMDVAGLDQSLVPPRYESSYFAHIWGSGYASGYYAYMWTDMLDENAFDWFQSHGGMTRENGDRFRKMVLSRGNSEDLETMYEDWLGGKPGIKPLLRAHGLVAEGQ